MAERAAGGLSKWLTLARNVALANLGRLRRPYRLTFVVNYLCNCRCAMCNIWRRPGRPEMALDEIRRFFAKASGVSWLTISGGEIFLREDIEDVFRSAAADCRDLFLVTIPTTGILTDRIVRGARILLESNIQRLIVTLSLDGPEDAHDELRRTPGCFRQVMETYRRLKEIRDGRLRVFFGYTLMKANSGQLFACIESVRTHLPHVAADDFHVNLGHTSGHYYSNLGMDLKPDGRALAVLDEFMRRRKHPLFDPVRWLERSYQRQAGRFIRTGRTPVPCAALTSSLFIDPYWNVYPCNSFDRVLGNLRATDYDLDAIWRADSSARARQEVAQGRCPHCWTPCEAYQSILADLLKRRARSPGLAR